MIAVIYTWPPDYAAAALSARVLSSLGVRVHLAIDRSHPVPAVEGATIIRTSFPRNGNLNGKACVIGQLETMASLADDDGYHLKVDSDALVMGLRWLDCRDEDLVGVHHPGGQSFYGFCYAVKGGSIPALLDAARAMPESRSCQEDIATGNLSERVWRYENQTPGCPFATYAWSTEKPPVWWRERYEVLLFQYGGAHGRASVRRAMRQFLTP